MRQITLHLVFLSEVITRYYLFDMILIEIIEEIAIDERAKLHKKSL